jgi:5-methylcytosine-specific restriction endonuclease McrA
MNILILDQKFKALVKSERKIMHEILLLIQTLDLTKSYCELAYSSLYEYLTKEIKYSEGAAQRRISSARLMREIPQIEKYLQDGSLNLSQVSLAHVAFKKEKFSQSRKEEILSKILSKNLYETKKVLLAECPNFHIPKAAPMPTREKKVQVTLEFTEEQWQEVQTLMARMSHKVPDQRIESALLYWAREIQKKQSASPPQRRQSVEPKLTQKLPPLRRRRRPIPAAVQKIVLTKANYQCEFVSPITRRRCEAKHFVESDHIIAVALGGSNEIENLQALCRQHNLSAAKLSGLSGSNSPSEKKSKHDSNRRY